MRGVEIGRLWYEVETRLGEPISKQTQERYGPLAWLFYRTKEQKQLTFNEILARIAAEYPGGLKLSLEPLWRSMAPRDHANWKPILPVTGHQVAFGLGLDMTREDVEVFFDGETVMRQARSMERQVQRTLIGIPEDVARLCSQIAVLETWQQREIRQRVEGYLGL